MSEEVGTRKVPREAADLGRAVHEIHGCTDFAELEERLVAHLVRDGERSFRVLFVDERSGAFFTRLPAADAEAVDPAVAPRLLEILEEGDGRMVAVEGLSLAPDRLPVRAAASLALRGQKYGLLLLESAAAELDEAAWQGVADALATDLVKLELCESAQREASHAAMKLAALNEAGELIKFVDLDVLLTKLMELSIRIMGAEVGAIALAADGELRAGVEWGLSQELLLSLRTKGGEPFLRRVLEDGEPRLVEDPASSDLLETDGLECRIQGLVAIPLVTQSEKLGVIVIVNPDGRDFEKSDFDVLSTIANLAASAVESAILHQAAVAHERFAAEVDLASKVQSSLLPKSAPEREGIELVGWNIPCTETGGDYFDFLDLGEGRTGVVIGDATGHGMGAALMMFIVRSTLRALMTQRDDPVAILTTMNDLVEESSPQDKFMTLLLGVVDEKGETLTCATAGHDPPLVHRRGRDDLVEPDTRAGIPLGVLPGSSYRVHEWELHPGETWVFGTDGIWEARNADGEFYGKERLAQVIRENAALELGALSERIREDIVAFHAGAEHYDDITAVLLRVTRPE